jgi:hypothetical protein
MEPGKGHEIMNLYQYYAKPEELIGHSQRQWLPEYILDAFQHRFTYDQSVQLSNRERSIIAQDPSTALEYARLTKRPFPEGEAAIATSARLSLNYAYEVLKKRFPLGEAQIIQDPFNADLYARSVMRSRWPQAEPIIAENPVSAFRYTMFLLKKPWPQGEKAIMQDPGRASDYAVDILQGPWPEAEHIIAQDPMAAYVYAKHALKAPFPQGEAAINSDNYTRRGYKYFLQKLAEPKVKKKPQTRVKKKSQ